MVGKSDELPGMPFDANTSGARDAADTAAPETADEALADAWALLNKYDFQHGKLTRLTGGNVNRVWRVEDTPYLLRVSKVNTDPAALDNGLRIATLLFQRGLQFASPAYPLLWQVDRPHGPVRGTLWFHEADSGERIDYEELGILVRRMQQEGTASLEVSGLMLPDVLSVPELEFGLEQLRTAGYIDAAEDRLMTGWLPRLRRTMNAHRDTPRVLTHDDLWPKNMVVTPQRGLVLVDPDNMGWGPAEYDLAFISRALEAKQINRGQVTDFERGYGGKVPTIDAAWRLAMFHRFRWVLHMLQRRGYDPNAAATLAKELPLWARKRGPQP